MLKPFTPTFIEYDINDPLGKLWCLCTLLPYVMGVVLCTVYFSFKRLGTAVFGIGVLANDALNFVVKNIIKEPRPSALRTDYGMPSRHAQYAAFFCALAFLGSRQKQKRPLVPLFLFTSAFSVCYSRVHLNYHTAPQVYYGALTGTVFAICWHYVLRPRVKRLRIVHFLHGIAK
eukprot:gene16438-25198_t